MMALHDLRAHLLADKILKLDPSNLKTFAEEGKIISYPSPPGVEPDNRDYQLKYEAQIYILSSSVDARYLFYVIAEWMNLWQPRHTADDLKFEADILSHSETDHEFRLSLYEDVRVTELDSGTELRSDFGHGDATPVRGVVTPERVGFSVIVSDPAVS